MRQRHTERYREIEKDTHRETEKDRGKERERDNLYQNMVLYLENSTLTNMREKQIQRQRDI